MMVKNINPLKFFSHEISILLNNVASSENISRIKQIRLFFLKIESKLALSREMVIGF